MSSDSRRAGAVIHTIQLTNFTLRKRHFEQLVHVTPPNAFHKTQGFAKAIAGYLGLEFVAALQERMCSIRRKGVRRK